MDAPEALAAGFQASVLFKRDDRDCPPSAKTRYAALLQLVDPRFLWLWRLCHMRRSRKGLVFED
eukprot:4122684-Pyramimonas_sp.AAC.1